MFKFIEDEVIGDIVFEATGKDLEELFESCGLATSESMVNVKDLGKKIKKEIKVENSKVDLMLFDFLDEIIFLKDSEQLLFKEFKIKINKNELKCVAYGEKLDKKKHELRHDVKAVTMHLFKVERVNNKWEAKVVLDI